MNRHLSAEDFVDAVEGGASAASSAHLRECESCAAQLADLQATLGETREIEPAEPSPLFWDHFSARVKGATSEQPVGSRWSLAAFGWRPIAAMAMVAGALVLGIYVRPTTAPEAGVVAGVMQPGTDAASLPIPALEDDGSWSLVTALASELDWNELNQATAPAGGTADSLIEELSSEQRETLARLLQKEMGDL